MHTLVLHSYSNFEDFSKTKSEIIDFLLASSFPSKIFMIRVVIGAIWWVMCKKVVLMVIISTAYCFYEPIVSSVIFLTFLQILSLKDDVGMTPCKTLKSCLLSRWISKSFDLWHNFYRKGRLHNERINTTLTKEARKPKSFQFSLSTSVRKREISCHGSIYFMHSFLLCWP